jgi:hypothetical protein
MAGARRCSGGYFAGEIGDGLKTGREWADGVAPRSNARAGGIGQADIRTGAPHRIPLAGMHFIWYSMLEMVPDARRPTAAENPADFLRHGGEERAGEGVAEGAG